ncbi:MAG TPA: hypothetical protein VGC56_13885 [Allosphingosinicella sp.]
MAAAAAMVLCAPADAAPRDADGVGEASGSYRSAMCPAHGVLAGLDLSVVYWLDVVTIHCVATDGDGIWTGTPTTATEGTIARDKPFPAGDLPILQASTHAVTCQSDTYITGLNMGTVLIGLSNKQGSIFLPWQMMGECRSRATGTVTEAGYGWTYFGDAPHGGLTGWDGMNGARSCRAGEVAVGIWAYSREDSIRKFGLKCQSRFEVIGRGTTSLVPNLALRKIPTTVVRSRDLNVLVAPNVRTVPGPATYRKTATPTISPSCGKNPMNCH